MLFVKTNILTNVLILLQRYLLLPISFIFAFNFGAGIHPMDMYAGGAGMTNQASNSVKSSMHLGTSCNTAFTPARYSRIKRAKRNIRRFGLKFLPILPHVPFISLNKTKDELYFHLKNHTIKGVAPPAYRLFSCYIN